ncbi:MAG TPA: AAA family ATPase [Candidatus Dormibacteraeota bacterium]|nr:AAA family ATPase [Candidatus Dormibacteraeota bacterium]
MLRGRRCECLVIDRLLAAARIGRSGALVVRGEAGIGKTALLEYAIESSSDLRVVRASGMESETELAFAVLHQLCAPLLDRRQRLPGPQRDALGTVFGLNAGSAPDRLLVGLAVLSLVSEAAAERPLLCVVDDAQWLDRESGQALGFVARRLLEESVAVVVAMREPSDDFRGLPELVVEGLQDADARELLTSAVRGPLDERVRERIVAEARGNPLALLELPRALSPGELAGSFGALDALPLSAPVTETFVRRLAALPEQTRLLVLVAAAEPAGDAALLRRAAERLGIPGEALAPAQRAGLLEIGARVRFRHPLVRSAVYRAASSGDRIRAHWALAEVTDPDVDPDHRVWHRAQATPGRDDDVAAELERAAGRAQARGGLAAAAVFLERAVGLTLDPAGRAQRALVAAQAKHVAGVPDAAVELLATAEVGPLDELGCARVDLLRAQLAFTRHRGRDAPPLLFRAARRLEPLDAALARETYLDALSAAVYVGQGASHAGLVDVARAALSAPPPSHPPAASDLLLDGLATRFTAGYAAAAPLLKRAVAAYTGQDISSREELRWMWLSAHTALDLMEDEAWQTLATRCLQIARDSGALTVLPATLGERIAAHAFAGELAEAEGLLEEQRAAREASGRCHPSYTVLAVVAWRGREADASEVIEPLAGEALALGEGIGIIHADWARAVLYNGLGRHEEALIAAERASEPPESQAVFRWAVLVELIVAAARTGHAERAAGALQRLSTMTRASGTEWALGIEAGLRALLSDGDAAERLHREAIDRLGRTRVRVELARAHLRYGEWLRRERRRSDAREQLRTAHTMFTAMGVEGYAQCAERELLATGEHVRPLEAPTRVYLTAQETQVARLAREGLSNPEIGARLFISARTAEYHLHKVFAKLAITSRTQLARVLPRETSATVAV